MNTFLDEATIRAQAGNGGNGSTHFRREKYVPLGGPDGGDGGNGGDVILRADRGINTLFQFKRQRHFAAEQGGPGREAKMHGSNGEDLVIPVPVGTVVRDANTAEELGDLTEPDAMLVVAKGGRGGLGNVHFKTSTNQAPAFAEKGEPGQARELDLELKVIADVGLVGLPNAGKSTLLSVLSAARPKIAEYPFTTLTPNLGVVEVGDSTFAVADIPGLIEGAHAGVGLGHEFLRHIERTLVLLHLVDGNGEEPMQAFEQIEAELRAYDADLLAKPQLVVVTKMDLPDAQERWPHLRDAFHQRGYDAVAISAATHEGLDELLARTAAILHEQRHLIAERTPEEVEVISLPPNPDYFTVERRRKTFFVHGETVERLAVMTDVSSPEAMYRLQQRLKRLGVFAALQRAGVHEGSRVMIGEVELIWSADAEEVAPDLADRVTRKARR